MTRWSSWEQYQKWLKAYPWDRHKYEDNNDKVE
jgi:hypothetical protein